MADDNEPGWPDFDADLEPTSDHNLEVARKFNLTWDPRANVWRDQDGCPCYDRYGQSLG